MLSMDNSHLEFMTANTCGNLTIPDGRIDICVLVAEPAVNDDYGGVVRVEVGVADGVGIVDVQSL